MNFSKLKKFIPYVLGVIIVIIALKFVFNNIMVSKDTSEFNPDAPMRIKEGGGYIYISKDGKKLTKDAYSFGTAFFGEYAMVRGKEEYQIINRDGKVVKSLGNGNNEYERLFDFNLWIFDGILHDNNLKKLTDTSVVAELEGNKCLIFYNEETGTKGLLNDKGEIIYESEDHFSLYGDSEKEEYLDPLYLISIDSEYGIIDCSTGKMIEPLGSDLSWSNNSHRYNLYEKEDINVIYNSEGKAKEIESDVEYWNYGLYTLEDYDNNTNAYYDAFTDKTYDIFEAGTIIDNRNYFHFDSNKYNYIPSKDTIYYDDSERDSEGIYNTDNAMVDEIFRIFPIEKNVYEYIDKETDKKILIYKNIDNHLKIVDLNSLEELLNINEDTYNSFYTPKVYGTFLVVDAEPEGIIVYNLYTGILKTFPDIYTFDVENNHLIYKDENGNEKIYNSYLEEIYEVDSEIDYDFGGSYDDLFSDEVFSDELPVFLSIFSEGNPFGDIIAGIIRYLIFVLIITIINVIAMYKLFVKLGESGWKIFIPIYNVYTYIQILGLPTYYIILFFIPIVNLYVGFKMLFALADAFDKPKSFAFFTVLFPYIAIPYLAFKKETDNYSSTPTNYHNDSVKHDAIEDDIPIIDLDFSEISENKNQPAETDYKFCPNCGNKVLKSETSCFICGEKLS